MIPRFVLYAIFLSGFASLGYELCWIRTGALLIGATPQALSIVVAIFFGGMAVGAFWFGHFSKKTAKSLLWYGILECAIGLLAAITPLLFGLVGNASLLTYQWAGTSQTLPFLVRSVLVAALLFPPCVLMGGTLPLLCQFSIHNKQADIRFAAGTLYATNTVGAFFGCMLCGLWFIPYMGTNAAIWLNATISFVVGAGFIMLAKKHHADAPPPIVETSQAPGTTMASKLTLFVMYGLFFCAGFAALGYEILWVRFLSLIIHNTVYTSTFSLGAILLGIAGGGWLVCQLKERRGQNVFLFAAANIFIAFSVLVTLLLPVTVWEWLRNSQFVFTQAFLCFVIILIPSIASGISFPLAYRLVTLNTVNSGRDFGLLTAVSTLGGIAGSLLVGFYLLPSQGLYSTLIIITCISLTIGTFTIFAFADQMTLLLRGVIAGGATVVWFGILFFSGTTLPADFLAGKRTMIEYVEGVSSFIAVVKQDGMIKLEIDRMWQGQNKKGHQIMAAHIPMILHQEPKSVLVVGLGTGQTASRFLMYDIERLDCVDIEKTLPGILQRHFDAAWLSDPRVHVISNDGRSYISSTSAKYDIVSIEVGQSFRPQVASFYTVDFYREVRKRLTKDGLACQFVPVGFFKHEEFRSVVRSFLEVFPQSTLWFNKYAELILIGNTTQQPLLSTKRLGLLNSNTEIHADLDYSFTDKPWLLMNKLDVFAANYLMGPQKLAKLSAGAVLYKDDRPILEYQTARTAYLPERFHDLMEKNLEGPDTIFAQKISIAEEVNIIKLREETIHEVLVK